MERVAVPICVVPNGRSNEVSAIGCNHAGLGETRARVRILDRRVDANEGDEDAKREVEGDEELVKCASSASKEDVEQDSQDDGNNIRAGS